MSKQFKPSSDKQTREQRNEDPISGEPGAHPVGAGVGAAVGGIAAGAAAGAVAGPVGTVAGAIIGGVVGGYAGKDVAEDLDPTVNSEYWRDHYSKGSYYDPDQDYESYEPAYQMGWQEYAPDRTWDKTEPELRARWESDLDKASADSRPDWSTARQACRDAWDCRQKTLASQNDASNATTKPR